jgi:glucosamine--fructose-6-phosphate aminotransferase (isomerizing)
VSRVPERGLGRGVAGEGSQRGLGRGGSVIAIATEGDREIKRLAEHVLYVPDTLEPLQPPLAVIPLQLIAYHAAVLRGCNVDKPRNLAKSVTVE